MAKLIYKKLKGNILEPMIALMIILFALTAAFVVVIQADQNNNVPVHIMAQQYAAGLMNRTIREKSFFDEEFRDEGLHFVKKTPWFDPDQNLQLIQIDIYDNRDRLLISRKRIIVRNANE